MSRLGPTPRSAPTQLAALLTLAAVLLCARAARAFDDPVLGPAPPLLTAGDASVVSPGAMYRDTIDRLRARLFGALPDARDPAPLPLDRRERARGAIAILPLEGVHPFVALDLRWAYATDAVIGPPLASDAFAYMLPGVVVTSRVGMLLGPFTLYGMAGAGSHRVLWYREGARPSGGWSGVVLGGFGASARLHRRLTVGVEGTAMRLTARGGPAEAGSPDPTQLVRGFAVAMRIAY